MNNHGLKWTLAMRLFLYETLLLQFGPYGDWGENYFPKGKKGEFENCLHKLSAHFSNKCGSKISSDAVRQQFKWAITTQHKAAPTHVMQLFKNKVAAHEAGFITTANLPNGVKM